ncbi:hypothetical protein ACRJ4W_16115 [Streptomyces sp. GLT-R25]
MQTFPTRLVRVEPSLRSARALAFSGPNWPSRSVVGSYSRCGSAETLIEMRRHGTERVVTGATLRGVPDDAAGDRRMVHRASDAPVAQPLRLLDPVRTHAGPPCSVA